MVMAPRPRRTPLLAIEQGYAMVALLVALSIMSIMMSVALPAWHTAARREKEAELVFRGEQYARALSLFSRRFANASPPNVDLLVTEKFLRKKYKDPITGGDFELLMPGTALAGASAPPGQRATTQTAGRAAGGSTSGSASSVGSLVSQLGRNTQSGARGNTTQSQSAARGLISQVSLTTGATGGITGVRSKSTEKSLRVYNGAEHYNEWLFIARQSGAAGTGAVGGAAGEQGGGEGRGARGAQNGRGRGTTPSSLSPNRGASSFGQPRGGGMPPPPPPPPPPTSPARGRSF
jgi:type II secretory pathway pseudopilin PulG